jgi:hypothetical protein
MPGLRGRVDHIDGSTSELIHRYTTVHEPGGVLPVACKTRRPLAVGTLGAWRREELARTSMICPVWSAGIIRRG